MKRFFFDMDGTIAQFYEASGCVEKFWEEGFFRNLKPYENMLEALKMLRERPDCRVYILSAAATSAMYDEKEDWVEKYINSSGPVACLFCKLKTSKAEYVANALDDFGEDFVLFDDYSANLVDWEEHGGTPVKVLNEINGRGWNGINFIGKTVSTEWSAEKIYSAICKMFDLEAEAA